MTAHPGKDISRQTDHFLAVIVEADDGIGVAGDVARIHKQPRELIQHLANAEGKVAYYGTE